MIMCGSDLVDNKNTVFSGNKCTLPVIGHFFVENYGKSMKWILVRFGRRKSVN